MKEYGTESELAIEDLDNWVCELEEKVKQQKARIRELRDEVFKWSVAARQWYEDRGVIDHADESAFQLALLVEQRWWPEGEVASSVKKEEK